jgi:hypothetical protein
LRVYRAAQRGGRRRSSYKLYKVLNTVPRTFRTVTEMKDGHRRRFLEKVSPQYVESNVIASEAVLSIWRFLRIVQRYPPATCVDEGLESRPFDWSQRALGSTVASRRDPGCKQQTWWTNDSEPIPDIFFANIDQPKRTRAPFDAEQDKYWRRPQCRASINKGACCDISFLCS